MPCCAVRPWGGTLVSRSWSDGRTLLRMAAIGAIALTVGCGAVGQGADSPVGPASVGATSFTGTLRGKFDSVAGTYQGDPLAWAADGGVWVSFDSVPGAPGNVNVVLSYQGAANGQFVVDGAAMEPVPGSQIIAAMGWTGDTPDPQGLLNEMVGSPIDYCFASPTELTLTGSGLVLHLKATDG